MDYQYTLDDMLEIANNKTYTADEIKYILLRATRCTNDISNDSGVSVEELRSIFLGKVSGTLINASKAERIIIACRGGY